MQSLSPPFLSLSRRIRRTPFTDRVQAAGITAYTVYNHMRLPTPFLSLEEDCAHLKKNAQIWDVSCERQVEIQGPNAAELVQKITPRSLATLSEGGCFYLPVVDNEGGMLNDPVILKLHDNHYWISLADSDLLLWIKGLAVGWGMDVRVREPEVFPLAVQGPKSDDLMEKIFGSAVRDIRFFRFVRLPFQGRELIVSRSGFSKQGGFEIYLDIPELGESLWDVLFEAGKPFNVRASGPNLIERIESGLLSYGNDMTQENTPYECGLGSFCHPEAMQECVGGEALRRREKESSLGICYFAIQGEPVSPCQSIWPLSKSGKRVGQITSAVWSPDFQTNVAIGMLDRSLVGEGGRVEVATQNQIRMAEMYSKPFKR